MKRAFSQCHPAVNFLFFTAVIGCTISFTHPVYLGICLLSALVYSVTLGGWRNLVFGLVLLPLAAAFALYYSSYTHFGVTILQQNLIGNNLTLESLAHGVSLGLRVAGVFLWLSCVFAIFTTDKVVYLFGTVSPVLSLFLAILLRLIPRIKVQARKIHTAQKGIGRGIGQGNLFQRIRNIFRIFSILITWTIETIVALSDSMRSRGSSLRGRTAFSIYRFDNRDRALVIGMFSCLSLTLMAILLQQTQMQFSPRLRLPAHTQISMVFAVCFGLLCILPTALEYWIRYRFWQRRHTL